MGQPCGPGRRRVQPIYNSFNAHWLLHWAGLQGSGVQKTLKEGLLKVYLTDDQSPASHEVLVRVAGESGLDPARADEMLASHAYTKEVREASRFT